MRCEAFESDGYNVGYTLLSIKFLFAPLSHLSAEAATRGACALMSRRAQTPPRVSDAKSKLSSPGGSTGKSGGVPKKINTPSLPAARNPRSGASSPSGTGTPSTSDRLRGTSASYTQKPKPSVLAARAAGLRNSDPDTMSPQASPSGGDPSKNGKRQPGTKGGRGSSELAEAPPEANLSIDVNSEDTQQEVSNGGDDEPFVPEEEEEGPSTQGDGLMEAKAKMRRQRSLNSPGLESPSSPVSARTPPCPALRVVRVSLAHADAYAATRTRPRAVCRHPGHGAIIGPYL